MENSVDLPVLAESSDGFQNDGVTRHNRSKPTDGSDKTRLPPDLVPDGQPTGRKSGMFPSLRRGSRKQTLSLNPEEREALENLIEEVILDGMGDGVVDSDGSSSDSDDDKTDDIFDNENSTTSDGSVANSSSKMSNHENTSPSATAAGKKYYPGQLKVALKHMSNLPPRFVRKLAKAQQYLDASSSSSTDEPVRPAVIVGRIEEEEEVGSGTHVKDESNSPVSSQPDKEKSKLKETKLQEAKKQIRTLLCDRDQYVDEKSLTMGSLAPINVASVTAAAEVPVKASVGKRHRTGKNNSSMRDSDLVTADVSNMAPRPASVLAMEAIVPSVVHVSKVAAFPVAQSLSANVPDFVPKRGAALPMAYSSSSATRLGSPFSRVSHDFGAMSPVQLENFARTGPNSVGSHDPQYYIQQTPVQGHPPSYYGMPQIYNTPPPTVGMSPRIIGDVLPSSANLVQPVSVSGVHLNNSGSYGLPSQYSLPPYSNVYSSPYLQHSTQSLQTNLYAPSHKPPVAYQMSDAYGIASSGNSAGVGDEFQYSMEQPSPVQYSGGAVSYVSFNGSSQGLHQPSWVSTSQTPGFAESPQKSKLGQTKWSASSSSVGRPSPSQNSRQTVRFAHSHGTPANRMTSSKNVPGIHSPTVKPSGALPYNSSYALTGSNWLQSAFSNARTSEQESAFQVERHPVSIDCLPPDGVDILLPVQDSSPRAGTPIKHGFNTKHKQTHPGESSGKTIEDGRICMSSSKRNDTSTYAFVNIGLAADQSQDYQEKAQNTLYSGQSVFSQSDSQEAVQGKLLPHFNSDFSAPVPMLDVESDFLSSSHGGDVSDSVHEVSFTLIESNSNKDAIAPAAATKPIQSVDVNSEPVHAIERIHTQCETNPSTPSDTIKADTDQVFVESNDACEHHDDDYDDDDHLGTSDSSEPSCVAPGDAVLGCDVKDVCLAEGSSVIVVAKANNDTTKHDISITAQVVARGAHFDANFNQASSDFYLESDNVTSAKESQREPDILLGSSKDASDQAASFQSSIQIPETSLVTLSSAFSEFLLKMFEPEYSHEGASSSASRQVFLNTDVLRQIYISLKESHNDT